MAVPHLSPPPPWALLSLSPWQEGSMAGSVQSRRSPPCLQPTCTTTASPPCAAQSPPCQSRVGPPGPNASGTHRLPQAWLPPTLPTQFPVSHKHSRLFQILTLLLLEVPTPEIPSPSSWLTTNMSHPVQIQLPCCHLSPRLFQSQPLCSGTCTQLSPRSGLSRQRLGHSQPKKVFTIYLKF